ncbi:TlpA family protein disulfide reductase [Thiolapillus sp.]
MHKVMSMTIWIVMLVIHVSALAAERESTLKLKFSDEALKKEMLSGETMALPEFEIFNSNGRSIYHVTGFDKNFQADVKGVLANPFPKDNTIDEAASKWFTLDDKPVRKSVFEGADFVFVEYWAEWCPSCIQQMHEVEGILENAPDLNILWVKVEKDPTKIKTMEVHMIRK